jgi:ParB-like chromosome segregation protein Spo0J
MLQRAVRNRNGKGQASMMKTSLVPIESIYVPVKRRATLDPEKVQSLANSIMETGQEAPILVRKDGERLVLIEGLHRLEACRQLGEVTIPAYFVAARRH